MSYVVCRMSYVVCRMSYVVKFSKKRARIASSFYFSLTYDLRHMTYDIFQAT